MVTKAIKYARVTTLIGGTRITMPEKTKESNMQYATNDTISVTKIFKISLNEEKRNTFLYGLNIRNEMKFTSTPIMTALRNDAILSAALSN